MNATSKITVQMKSLESQILNLGFVTSLRD